MECFTKEELAVFTDEQKAVMIKATKTLEMFKKASLVGNPNNELLGIIDEAEKSINIAVDMLNKNQKK